MNISLRIYSAFAHYLRDRFFCVSRHRACLIRGNVSRGENPGYLQQHQYVESSNRYTARSLGTPRYTTSVGTNPFSDFLTPVVHAWCCRPGVRAYARELLSPRVTSVETHEVSWQKDRGGRRREKRRETESIDGCSRTIAVAGRQQLARPNANRPLI